MGYTTDFSGRFELNKPLGTKMSQFLKLFNETRRMGRRVEEAFGVDGEFYVFGEGSYGQDKEANIINYNEAPSTQPGLWCQWTPSDDNNAIEWDGNEKFYNYTEWLVYLINKVLAPNGYILNGTVTWQGEETGDVGEIFVRDNRVFTQEWKGSEIEHTVTSCEVYGFPNNRTNFMRPEVVLILTEDGRELAPETVLQLPESTTEAPIEFSINVTGSGSKKELVEALVRLTASIADGEYDEGGTFEDSTICAEIKEE